jgi:hypothetical protein
LEIIGTNWNKVFPLNIVLAYITIVISAYIVKIIANIFSQTFREETYNWVKIIDIRK